MLSQRQQAASRNQAGKGDGNGDSDYRAATLNGHNDLPLDLFPSEKCSSLPTPLAASATADRGNKLLNYQQHDARNNLPPPPPLPLNDGDQWENQLASKQLAVDIDRRPCLVRANSLNTNSTGERSKCDEEEDEDEDEDEDQDHREEDDDEKRRFLDETNKTRVTRLGREDKRGFFGLQQGEKKKKKNNNNNNNNNQNETTTKKKANLARQESIFDQEQASVRSSGGEGATEQEESGKKTNKQKDKSKNKNKKKKRRQEPGDADEPPGGRQPKSNSRDPSSPCCSSCWLSRMFHFLSARKWLVIPLLILVNYCIAIYCLPFLTQQEPKVPDKLPVIPFDFNTGPLRPSSASAFKAEYLFKNQLHGPESLDFDSQGNCYMAVEGGFILYAHLNKSSPIKRTYLDLPPPAVLPPSGVSALLQQRLEQQQQQQQQQQLPDLIKIAELNGMRQTVVGARTGRPQRDSSGRASWQRECQLDEKIYGSQLYEQIQVEQGRPKNFKSNVRVSRCSKPLGVRLSRDESSLYVIDTLAGLYRINLRAADKPHSMSQRQVTKLIDFRANNGHQVLPAIQLEDESETGEAGGTLQATRLVNVSLKAVDDLTIDHRRGYDLIYMTVASQQWPAMSFVYDALEGRPSGLVVRYDTSTSLLAVLEPTRLAHVRTSAIVEDEQARQQFNKSLLRGRSGPWPSIMMGAPRLDENDVFDDRRLNFPNGIQLTDDGRALLIADTLNKRIIRHYVRGTRRGTSDLWAWTPMFPDNIRRGYDKQQESYWVVGCGKSPSSVESKLPAILPEGDILSLLRTWPRLRKFLSKNIYFFGHLVEFMGANVLKSNRVEDFGYELRIGSSVSSTGCSGMMIIQYNQFGDIIRSVHSREFPNDLSYYSQVNELIDPNTGEHSLYLGSPSYNYLTKLVLPPADGSQIPLSPPNGMFEGT